MATATHVSQLKARHEAAPMPTSVFVQAESSEWQDNRSENGRPGGGCSETHKGTRTPDIVPVLKPAGRDLLAEACSVAVYLQKFLRRRPCHRSVSSGMPPHSNTVPLPSLQPKSLTHEKERALLHK